MKKILLIVPNLGIGGQEKIAVETARLLDTEYEVDIVVFERLEKEYRTKANIININLGTQNILFKKIITVLKRNTEIKKLKKKNNYIASYSFGDIANVSNILSKVNEVCIASIHGFSSIPKSIFSKIFYKYLILRATHTVCVSKLIYEEMKRAVKLNSNKISVLYNPYDIEAINLLKEPAKKFSEDTFLAVGRLEEVKGYENLIYSFKIAKERKPNIQLKIIGEGSLKEDLQELVVKLNLENNIEFIGFKTNPYQYYSGAKAFVLSSYNEGFPNAIIESLACKTPVIAVDCFSGPREILLNDNNFSKSVEEIEICNSGILSPAFMMNDTDSERQKKQTQFAKAILYLLDNKEYYDSCCENGYKLALNYSSERYKDDLKRLF